MSTRPLAQARTRIVVGSLVGLTLALTVAVSTPSAQVHPRTNQRRGLPVRDRAPRDARHRPPTTAPLSPVPGRNANMVSGRTWPDGDPFLQRQNEPSVAASTRNPLHLVAGANDYRTVDLPGLPDGDVTGDAWVGLFKSFDGGQTWRSTLVPGYPQDASRDSARNPHPDPAKCGLFGYQAAADPVVRAGTNGLLLLQRPRVRPGGGRSQCRLRRAVHRQQQQRERRFGRPSRHHPGREPPRHHVHRQAVAGGGHPAPGLRPVRLSHPARPSRRSPRRCRPGGGRRTRIQRVGRHDGGAHHVLLFARLRGALEHPRPAEPGGGPGEPGRVESIDPAQRQRLRRVAPVRDCRRRLGRHHGGEVGELRPLVRPAGLRAPVPAWPRRGLRDEFAEHRRPGTPRKRTELDSFDQGTSADALSFRTNAYPTMTFDDQGRLYVAWTERGFATLGLGPGHRGRPHREAHLPQLLQLHRAARRGRRGAARAPAHAHARLRRGASAAGLLRSARGRVADLHPVRGRPDRHLVVIAGQAPHHRHPRVDGRAGRHAGVQCRRRRCRTT